MGIQIKAKIPFLILLIGLGGAFVTFILALGYYEKLIDFVVASQTRIIEGTPSYAQWQKIPIPVYLRVRFFNITNPKEFENGEKVKVVEMGPYTYKESMEKFDITFDKETDTVRYRQVRFYYFQPDLSDGRELDKITMINLPFLGAAKLINDYTDQKFILSTFEGMLADRGEKLTSTHSVKEILFDGFSVATLLELANSDIVKQAHKIKLLKPISKFKIPARMANGKMGIFEGKNGSDEGWFQVRTGIENSDDFGRVVSWNGKTDLKLWNGPECNTPTGTDGIIYQPFQTAETKLEAFVPDLCRSIYFTVHGTVDHGWIKTFRYRQPLEMFETIDKNPDNYCYCEAENVAKCPPKGLISVAPCFEGAPVVMSQPHFFGADPSVLENIEGLAPDADKHWGYIDLHPRTGLSVEVSQRLQFGMKLSRWTTMPTFSKVLPAYIPMLWIEEGGELDAFNTFLLTFLDTSMVMWAIGKWAMVGGWLLLAGFGGFLISRQKRNKKSDNSTTSLDDSTPDEIPTVTKSLEEKKGIDD